MHVLKICNENYTEICDLENYNDKLHSLVDMFNNPGTSRARHSELDGNGLLIFF